MRCILIAADLEVTVRLLLHRADSVRSIEPKICRDRPIRNSLKSFDTRCLPHEPTCNLETTMLRLSAVCFFCHCSPYVVQSVHNAESNNFVWFSKFKRCFSQHLIKAFDTSALVGSSLPRPSRAPSPALQCCLRKKDLNTTWIAISMQYMQPSYTLHQISALPAEKLPLHFLSLRLCLPWLFRVARHSRILAAGDHHQTQTGVCCSHYPLDAGKHTCWDTWISNTTLVDKPCQARGNSRSLQRAEQK